MTPDITDLAVGSIRTLRELTQRIPFGGGILADSLHDAVKGKTIMITGASSGIGEAAALQIGKAGGKVLLVARTKEKLDAVAEQVQDVGGTGIVHTCDLSDSDDVERMAQEVLAQHGQVDILVNNAGTAWFGPTDELDVPTFDQLFAANVRPAYFLTAALAPAMAAKGSGSIINVGSMAGEVGMPGGAAYGATKAALDAMTRSWAAEFSPAGVRVNTVASGPVYSAIQPAEVTKAVGATTIMARAAQPEEIASVITFLASPQASYITGAVISADGGRAAI